MLLLSVLMTGGSLGHSSEAALILKQPISGGRTDLHFLCLWCPLFPAPGYGCAIKGEHVFQILILRADPQAPLILVFCLGRVLMGITSSPKRRPTEGGPPPSTGYETSVWASSSQQQHLFVSSLNNTWMAGSIKSSCKITNLFIVAHLPFIFMSYFYLWARLYFCCCCCWWWFVWLLSLLFLLSKINWLDPK